MLPSIIFSHLIPKNLEMQSAVSLSKPKHYTEVIIIIIKVNIVLDGGLVVQGGGVMIGNNVNISGKIRTHRRVKGKIQTHKRLKKKKKMSLFISTKNTICKFSG